MSTEVRSQAKHRTFSAADKARILSEYEAAGTPLERAAVMRRSGVYSSLLSNWRKQVATGQPPSKRGRPANPQAAEIIHLRKENERLQRRLARSEHVVAALGKAHALLQMVVTGGLKPIDTFRQTTLRYHAEQRRTSIWQCGTTCAKCGCFSSCFRERMHLATIFVMLVIRLGATSQTVQRE